MMNFKSVCIDISFIQKDTIHIVNVVFIPIQCKLFQILQHIVNIDIQTYEYTYTLVLSLDIQMYAPFQYLCVFLSKQIQVHQLSHDWSLCHVTSALYVQ